MFPPPPASSPALSGFIRTWIIDFNFEEKHEAVVMVMVKMIKMVKMAIGVMVVLDYGHLHKR